MYISPSCLMLSTLDGLSFPSQPEQGREVIFGDVRRKLNCIMGHEKPLSTAFSSWSGDALLLMRRIARRRILCRGALLPALEERTDSTCAAAGRDEPLELVDFVNQDSDALVD